jgi:hypothetical protein
MMKKAQVTSAMPTMIAPTMIRPPPKFPASPELPPA